MADENTATPSQDSPSPSAHDNGLGLGDFLKEVVAEPKAETPKADEKPVAEEQPAETKPEVKAEEKADEKPEEKTDKRLKDTQKWANTLNQQLLEVNAKLASLQTENRTLQQKIDGTYEAPKPESAEALIQREVMNTKVAVSIEAAKELYGEEEVNRLIFADDAPFKELDKDPAIRARVYAKGLPVVEAIKVVKEHEAKQKYGNDPEKMREAIRAEEREKLTKEFAAKAEAERKQAVKPKLDTLAGLSGVRGVSKDETKESETQPVDLNELFPAFAKKVAI